MSNDNRVFDSDPSPERDPGRQESTENRGQTRESNVVPIRGSTLHDPSVDYHPPNPGMVIPPAHMVLKLTGALAGTIVFALFLWLMFHNWMAPGPRHPGQQKSGQGLEQKIP